MRSLNVKADFGQLLGFLNVLGLKLLYPFNT